MTSQANATTEATAENGSGDLKQRAGELLGNVAGYVGHRTIATGLRAGLIEAVADASEPAEAEALARVTGHDPFYVQVWCRAALAAGILQASERDGPYELADHVDTLLLDQQSPAYIGGVFLVLEQPEVFDHFEERLPSGERTWWDRCSEDFIQSVGRTGAPFYRRLVPGGLQQVDGLHARLQAGGAVLDTACGTGNGLRQLLETYRDITAVGADGDATSLELAAERLEEVGLADRVEFVHTPLEQLDLDREFDLVTNNVSMHECRDIDAATACIRSVLRPGGWFVISDFPFPEDVDGLRTVPGRIMSGIQFFEAQIDDQLLPPSVYVDLLGRHGFEDVQVIELTPVHALTVGRRPVD